MSRAEPLWWLVHEIDGARVVRIQEGGALIFARLNAAIDGFGGAFVEAHPLDAKTAKKIPKRMVGCKLRDGRGGGAARRAMTKPPTRTAYSVGAPITLPVPGCTKCRRWQALQVIASYRSMFGSTSSAHQPCTYWPVLGQRKRNAPMLTPTSARA